MNDSHPAVLRSHANPTVRRLARLRDNRTRRRSRRVLVDGWRETKQAISAGLQLIGLYIPESSLRSREGGADVDSAGEIIRYVAAEGKLYVVSDELMQKISFGESARGVLAEFSEPQRSLAALVIPENALVLVLDRLEKPGNIGAIFRSADAAGVDAVILCGTGSDLFNPNAIRSSLGAVFRIPSATVSELEAEQFLIAMNLQVVSARVESSQELWSTDFSQSLALIMGSEAEGLGDRWQVVGGKPVAGVRIPMFGKVDSLNVSASAAVILFEAKRQRQARKGSGSAAGSIQ